MKNCIPDEILLQVEKPARYTGNEINMVIKNPEEVDIRFGFCFPDVYEVGMSHLGLQILYYFLNMGVPYLLQYQLSQFSLFSLYIFKGGYIKQPPRSHSLILF